MTHEEALQWHLQAAKESDLKAIKDFHMRELRKQLEPCKPNCTYGHRNDRDLS